MADDEGQIYWYDPDPRAILPLDQFHVPRRMQRSLRKNQFEVYVDHDFSAVINACAETAPGREETWINEEIIEAYIRLHQLGFAHSVESWLEGKLVGGLYGVTVGGLFAGESMFSRVKDASKTALYYLTQRLKHGGYQLLDVQFLTEHLRRFGAIEISREDYKRRLRKALAVSARF